MKNKPNNRLILLAAGACALVLATERTYALPSLTLFDGTTTITVLDGGLNDSSSQAGVVTYNGLIGVWDINVSTGLTKPTLGSATFPQLDLNSVNHSTGAGTLMITFTETGFNTGNMGFMAEIGGTQSGGIVSINSKTLQGTNLVASIGTLTATPFMGTSLGTFAASTNYSLSDIITIVHTAAGTTSFDKSLNPISVPDGGLTAMMLGLGFLGVEGARRKFKTA